jgi:hypothetical protein
MAISRLKWNYPGLGEIMRSPTMQADLLRRAKAVATAAEGASGEAYLTDSGVGRKRARASARTGSVAAARKEATDHVLLRSLDAARD